MRKVITFFIKYPTMVNLGMLVFVIFGFLGYKSLKSSFFPEASVQFIFIETTYLGASPEEIEEGIVLKIEDNLKGITGMDRVTSVSNENRALITVELKTGANLNQVFEDVENAVDRISSFPDQMEPPVIYKQEVLNFASNFAISGGVSLKELKKYARKVENDLRAVPGISKVTLAGFPEEEIEVSLRENDMRAFQITFEEVNQAVRNANLEITGGTIKGREEEMSIRAKTKQYYAEGFMDIVVKSTADAKVVRIRDIAEVKDQWEDSPEKSFINGQRSVTVSVSTTREEDILTAASYINDYIETFNQENQVVKATLIRDGTVPLVQRLEVLTRNGLIGATLVFLLLAIFLNLRLAFWVAIGIPLSFLGMFIIAPSYGLTINILSLFGMIVVIGILVDDGVVVGESIFQEAERGKKPLQAAIDGTMKVMPPVIVAILTTIVAFSLFFFLDGILGEYFSDIAFVVIVTLGVSLVEVATFLPSHLAHSHALRGGFKSNKFERYMDGVMITMRDKLYAPVLRFVIHHKAFSLMVATATFILSIGVIRGDLVKTTFFPNIDSDNIIVTVELAPGTNENITKEQLDEIEAAAWQVNEDFTARRSDDNQTVIKIEKNVGPMSHQGSLNIVMLDGETRGVRSLVIQEALRKQAGEIKAAKKLSYTGFSPFGKPVSVSLTSNDLAELDAAKNALKEALNQMPELRDVIDNQQEGLREIKIELKDKAKLIGLNLQQVVTQVRQGFYGLEVQRLQRGEDEVKVWVRYSHADRTAINKLENMRIRVPGGGSYPLSEIATFNMDKGVIAINHQDGKREVRVEADISSNDVSAPDINTAIEEAILPGLYAQYPGLKATFEGQVRTSAKTAKSAQVAGPVVLVLMVALLVISFRSFSQASVVLLLVPLSLVGVVVGHFIHGQAISILSGLGMIALIGVLVNDSLVFISTFNRRLKEGKAFEEALYQTGLSRFRPIFLTSVTTVAGLGPLILEKSFQAQFLIPMAISIAYGLAAATVLTLLVLPTLLIIINRVKVYTKWLWQGQRPEPESVEAAVKETKAEFLDEYV